jgi:hypothetical protein
MVVWSHFRDAGIDLQSNTGGQTEVGSNLILSLSELYYSIENRMAEAQWIVLLAYPTETGQKFRYY